MSRDKQISEIAEIILDVDRSYYGMACDEIQAKAEATAIYDKDFRKASEVAREIFEEIDSTLKEIKDDFRADGELHHVSAVRYAMIRLAELKKKYIGKDTNVTTKKSEDTEC